MHLLAANSGTKHILQEFYFQSIFRNSRVVINE